MYRATWSIDSPLSPMQLADRIGSAPRWNGWRDGFNDGRFLIAEDSPVYSGLDGFQFVVPLNPRWPVAVRGTFHTTGESTRIEVRANPPQTMILILSLTTLPIIAVPLVGLWPISAWLAIGVSLPVIAFVAAMVTFGYWWNVKAVQKRLNEMLLAPEGSPEQMNLFTSGQGRDAPLDNAR